MVIPFKKHHPQEYLLKQKQQYGLRRSLEDLRASNELTCDKLDEVCRLLQACKKDGGA